MRQRRCLPIQNGQLQRVAVIPVFDEIGLFFVGRNLNRAAIQRTGFVLAKRHQNRRRQQVVVFRRLRLRQAVFTSLQARKCRIVGGISILALNHQLALVIGNTILRIAFLHLAARIQLLQRKLNACQQLLLVVLAIVLGRLLGNIQRKLRVLLPVGDGHGLLCIVT